MTAQARYCLIVAAVIAFPAFFIMLVVLSSFADLQPENWRHLMAHVLPRVLSNSFWLVCGVTLLSLVLGITLAWLTAVCKFPGQKFFDWALMLPMAMPAYVLAFVYIGLFDFTGPVFTALRGWGIHITGLEIRSRGGVILVMSLALYPYVYLILRNAFATQGSRALEVAQTLGYSRWQGFWRLALPLARPWVGGAAMLVIMETLADFGAVAIFNYDSFTTAIYSAWFGLHSTATALQLASFLLVIIMLLLWLESGLGVRRRYDHQEPVQRRIELSRWQAWMATGFAGTVLFFAFVMPVTQLVLWAMQSYQVEINQQYWSYVEHTLYLGVIAAFLIVALALLMVYVRRGYPPYLRQWPMILLSRISTLGYALPGPLLAVGLMLPLVWLSARLNEWGLGLWLLHSSLATLMLGYAVRFMAVGLNPLDAGITRITRSIDEAARSLGASASSLLVRIHLPMLRGALLTALLLVAVDVMKEMPITLMVRPFGWDTLAVRIFELTSEGEWQRAAMPALVLLLVGLIPVGVLMRGMYSAGRTGEN